MRSHIFLICFLTSQVTRAALPPTPRVECTYPDGGYAQLVVKFQSPLVVEGHVFHEFTVHSPSTALCPNSGDFDSQLMRNYRGEFQVYAGHRTEYKNGESRCVWFKRQYVNFHVPVRKFRNGIHEFSGFTILNETLEPVPEKLCDQDR